MDLSYIVSVDRFRPSVSGLGGDLYLDIDAVGLPVVGVWYWVEPANCYQLLTHALLERLEPVVGIEPTTYGLRNRCSTTELHWRARRKMEPNRNKFSFFQRLL